MTQNRIHLESKTTKFANLECVLDAKRFTGHLRFGKAEGFNRVWNSERLRKKFVLKNSGGRFKVSTRNS